MCKPWALFIENKQQKNPTKFKSGERVFVVEGYMEASDVVSKS